MGLFSWLFGSKSTRATHQPKIVYRAHQLPKPESSWEVATVKRGLAQERGFGFLSREGGRADIYVHHSLLKKCRINELKEGQKVEVRWASVKKGLEAGEVRLLK